MTATEARLILLIDGNNLAHFLYTNLAPGQKMTAAFSQLLVTHLASYARTYAQDLKVELCLDRSPGELPQLPGNLRVLFAEYPQTADDLLLGRFWFHQDSARPCLVITNDEAILDEVHGAQGFSLRVYDFVHRPGTVSPVFRAPDELPDIPYSPVAAAPHTHLHSLSTSIYFRIIEEDQAKSSQPAPLEKNLSQKTSRKKQQTEPAQPQELPETMVQTSPPGTTIQTPSEEAQTKIPCEVETPQEIGPEEPYYFLSLNTWPVAEGVRFLLNSFCAQHREAYREMMAAFDLDGLGPADLRALAELLLHACGSEPEFARRGALMARVRLALLQARGEPLSLRKLAEKTGYPVTGLRGRIKGKAAPWVEILDP